jgi:hypothetical protein
MAERKFLIKPYFANLSTTTGHSLNSVVAERILLERICKSGKFLATLAFIRIFNHHTSLCKDQ